MGRGDATTSMTSIFMFIENKSQIHNEVVYHSWGHMNSMAESHIASDMFFSTLITDYRNS